MDATRSFPAPAARQGGFTLIEAIAAFVLLALFIGVLMSALSMSMRNTIRAEEASLAAQWAQSKLDLVGIGEKLEEGDSDGRFDDDYRWAMHVEAYEPPREVEPEVPIDPAALGMSLYRVELTVSWGDRRAPQSATFATLRAYAPDQAVLFNTEGQPGQPGLGLPGAAGGAMPGGGPGLRQAAPPARTTVRRGASEDG